MVIIASCGHELTKEEGLGYDVEFEDVTREGEPCTVSACYCLKCKQELEEGYLDANNN